MDASDSSATTVEGYLKGTPDWRTDLYSTCATLLTHGESIDLFKDLGVKMTPELKTPSVSMPFNGFTQDAFAQKLVDEYKERGVSADHVWYKHTHTY
jgi:glycerophosphoryl diester phosphodiesterase